MAADALDTRLGNLGKEPGSGRRGKQAHPSSLTMPSAQAFYMSSSSERQRFIWTLRACRLYLADPKVQVRNTGCELRLLRKMTKQEDDHS